MTRLNALLRQPPHALERALKRLGTDLRTARIRRRITVAKAADRIGVGPRAVIDAEMGKATACIATYAALLRLYGMLGKFEALADPAADAEGLALELARGPARARAGAQDLSDDF